MQEPTVLKIIKKRRIPIYEARMEARSSAYNYALGALTYVVSNESPYLESVKKFAAELIETMHSDYEKELREIKERCDVNEFK